MTRLEKSTYGRLIICNPHKAAEPAKGPMTLSAEYDGIGNVKIYATDSKGQAFALLSLESDDSQFTLYPPTPKDQP